MYTTPKQTQPMSDSNGGQGLEQPQHVQTSLYPNIVEELRLR